MDTHKKPRLTRQVVSALNYALSHLESIREDMGDVGEPSDGYTLDMQQDMDRACDWIKGMQSWYRSRHCT